MRSILLIVMPLISACGTVPASAPELPVNRETSQFVCRDEGMQRFVGQLANVDVAGEILRASGARMLRWTGPGVAVTMDLRSDRVNVDLDATLSRITGISCG